MCLVSWSVVHFWLVCVCLLCRKLCSYQVLQWLFAQGDSFGWTPLLRCCLMCVVPSLYSVVFCTRVAWVWLRLYKEDGSSPMSLQWPRGGIWTCMRCPCLCLCWVLGWGSMLANFHMCGINRSFQHAREVFNMLVRFSTWSWGMRVQEGICVLGAWCLVCQDLVICYFYFVLLLIGTEFSWVWCYILVFYVLLC